MKLKRISLDDNILFSSAGMVIDEEKSADKVVAVVLFSGGGNLIYLHNKEYLSQNNLDLIQVTAEKFFGETLKASRIKVFSCEVVEAAKY